MEATAFSTGANPFGSVDLNPSRDFFAPLASAQVAHAPPVAPVAATAPAVAALPIETRLAPPIPALAPPKSSAAHGFMAFCKRNNTVLTVIVLICGIVATCMTVYYAHKKAQTRKGPWHSEILAVPDPERRHDLKELEYLWQISRRKTVKDMLDRALKAELSPEPQAPPEIDEAALGDAEAEDPFFTAA